MKTMMHAVENKTAAILRTTKDHVVKENAGDQIIYWRATKQ